MRNNVSFVPGNTFKMRALLLPPATPGAECGQDIRGPRINHARITTENRARIRETTRIQWLQALSTPPPPAARPLSPGQTSECAVEAPSF